MKTDKAFHPMWRGRSLRLSRRTNNGFTLIEVMIVVVIVAILAALAVPSYQNHVRKTYRKDAQATLQGFAQAMERFYAQNNTYLGAAGTALDPDVGPPVIFSTQAPLDGVARYDLTVSATASAYTLAATPIADGPQASDGALRLLSTGLRGWDRNNDGDFNDSGEGSWAE